MEAVCVSTFPSCYISFCIKKKGKYANSKPQLLLTAGLSRHKNGIMQQIGKKIDLTTHVESTVFCSAHEICHSLAIFFFQIWIEMSYFGCPRLCEALIMDWRQYFCPLLSVMTAVSELNIKLMPRWQMPRVVFILLE